MLRLIIPLIAGILAGYFLPHEAVYHYAIILAIISFFLFVFLAANYRRFSLYRFRWVAGSLIYFLLLAAGYWHTVYSSERFDRSHYSVRKADALAVEIKSEPKYSNNVSRFEAHVNTSYSQGVEFMATGNLVISVGADSTKIPKFNYGDVLLIPAIYNSVDPPYNPGEFNYRSYLADRQIYDQTFLAKDQLFLIDRDKGNRVISFALRFRKQLVDKFYRYLPDRNAAAFASTLILGYRAELSRELVEAYSRTGTMHVLSVSGMHVGIVFIVLSVLLKFMDKTQSTRLIRALVIIGIIWFYAMLTGFSAPASRAAVMLSFIVLGKALNKSQNTYNLIAISAFFLLLYNPFYLLDAGFQLSYLAVIGLVYFHPRIYQAVYIRNKLLDYIWSYSALSIAAQLATFPLSVYYFHQFPVYFLLSNLLIVLPVAIIMYAGIAFMFIPPSIILLYMGQMLNWLINATNSILYYIENLPFSGLDGLWINTFECALMGFVLIFISLLISYGYKKFLLTAAVLLVILFLSFSLRWIRNYDRHEIVFYNLKKNTAMAYIFKHRSVIISDLDSSDKLMNFLVLPTVKSKGSGFETFYNIRDTFESEFYAGDPNFYQFGNYWILRWNKNFDNTVFSNILKIDAVLISGNPRTTLKDMKACLKFTRVIIDANNPDYKVKGWISEAEKFNLEYYVLKKNQALTVKLLNRRILYLPPRRLLPK